MRSPSATDGATDQDEPAGHGRGIQPQQLLQLIGRHKALLCGGLVLVYVLGFLYYWAQEPAYEARASVLVHHTGDSLTGKGIGQTDPHDNYLPTHVRLMTSSGVLNRARERLIISGALGGTPPSADEIARRLKVIAEKDTEILEIAYRTPNRTSAAPVVEAVVGSYQDFVNETQRSTSKEVLQILTQQKDDLGRQLRAKEKELLALQQKEGVWTLQDDKSSVVLSRLDGLGQALTQAHVRRLDVEGQSRALDEAITRNDPPSTYLLPYLEKIGREQVLAKLGLSAADEAARLQTEAAQHDLLRDQLELRRLNAVCGPNHPKVLELQDRIRVLSDSVKQEEARVQAASRDVAALRDLAVHLQEQELAEARQAEQDLQQQYDREKQKVIDFNIRNVPVAALEAEVVRLRGYNDALVNRIRDVNLGDDYDAISTRVIDPPQEPTVPVSPNLVRIALLSTIIGLLAGVGLCYLADWWDTSYRGAEDVARQLGLPVIGCVPAVNLRGNEAAFDLITHQARQSVEAEAFRTLRTALMLSPERLTKLTVTSALPEEGKTSILSNLGIAFAQSGLRTLLIDGDLRRPRLHRVFDLPGATGLAGLLAQEDLAPEHLWGAVRTTSVDLLHVLPAGTRPPNPAELLSGGRMAQILQWAEGRYDRILCDAPPIGAVADGALLGRVSNGALFVVHPERADRLSCGHALAALRRMNCPVLGVIINGASGRNGYGYGYRYGRRYGAYHPEDDTSAGAEPVDQTTATPGADDVAPPEAA